MGDEYLPQNQTTNEKISVNEGIVEFDSLETHYKQTKEKLRFHESLIYSMTDTSPLAFYVVDNRTDEVLYFNHRFCEIWGITHLEEAMRRGELKNQDIVPYCLPLVKNVPAFLESCKPLQNEEVRFTVEDEIQFVDGRTIRRVSSQIRGELDRYFGRLYIFEDVTDRKRLDDELRKITERIINYQKALLELAKMVNSDLELTLKRVTEVDSRTLGVERVSVWLFNEDHSEIVCKDLYKMSENVHEKGLRLQAKDYPRYFHALEESRTLAANDALTDPRTSEYTEGYLKPYRISSMMDVPIRVDGKVVGIVCHEHTGPMREWELEEQNFAASIADVGSLALEASERNRIEEALRKGEERYRALYEDNPSMYFTVDLEGKVLSVNLFGAEQLGYKAHELVGQSVLMIFHPDDREGVLKQMMVCLQNPNQLFHWEFRKIRKDGCILWVKEAARAIQGAEGGVVVLISCEDITERKQMEEALRKAKYDLEIKVEERTSELRKSNEQLLAEIGDRKRTEEDLNKRNRDLEILNAITQAVHQSLAPKEVYRVALDKVIELENVDLACIYLVDEARNEAVIQDQRNIPEWFIQRAGRIPYPKGVTWRVINTGNIINVKNAQEDPDVGPAGRELGFQGMLGIPITLESKTIGVIWLISYKEYLFTRSEEELLLSICSQISIAISKARLYEREFNQRKRIEALQVVSQSVTSKLDYRSVLQDVVENTNSFMGSRFSIIALQEGDYYIPKAVAGDDEGLREVIQISPDPENMWGRGRGGECLRTKTPIVAYDLRNDPPLIWRTELIKRGILSVAIVPLIIKGEVKGLLLTYSQEPYAFNEDKKNLLSSFANQAAIAIENSKLYEETKRQADELRTLYEDLNKRNRELEVLNRELSKKNRYETIISTVTRSVHQSINLQDVLENAVETMSKNMDGLDNVCIYLVEGEEADSTGSPQAVMKAYRGYPDWFIDRVRRIPYPKGFTWKTIIDEKPRYCADVDQDTVIGPAGREMGTKSYASMPIQFGDKTVGCININSLKKNAFDEEEIKLLEIVSHQIEIAINNARRAELLRQSEERYRTLFDQSPVGVYIFDRDYKITHCNERFVQILQSSFDKIIGVDIRKLKDQCVLPLMEKILRGETAVYEGYYEATGSEAKLWASVRLSPLRDANGKVTGGMAVVEDITDRKQAEVALKESFSQLSKKNRYETIISTVTRSVHQTINLQDVFENAVEAMSKNIDKADNVSIYLVEGEEADSTLRQAQGSPQAVIKSYRGYSEAFIGKVRRIPYPKGFTWKTIIEGKPLYCPDVDQDTVIGPAGREVGTKSYASMPIRFEGETVGCININSLEKDAFDEEELKLLEIVAHQIEIAITNAQQAELLYQAKEELELRVQERTQELSEINEELRKEIAERNRVEEEIRQTQSFLNSVVENIPDMIFVKDAKDLKFVRFNKAGEELLGYSRENLIGKTDYDFFPKGEADFFTSKDREVLEGSKLHDIPEEPIHTRNKGRRILHTKKIPIFNAVGKPRYLLGISEDITERKRVEEQIKSSLEEKEVLLKEIHHRVKNNLQVISSLLDLQSEYVKGKKTREVFHETQNRVRAIAHIHERLYQSKDLARIDFAEYIRHLGNYLFQSYGVDPNFIKLKVNVKDVVLDVNTAIPCGLIINELISNSLKHAFRKRKKGEIRIDLYSDIKRADSHRYRLYTMTVRDNGVGFPKDLDFRNTESLGLQLVNALTNQIGGSIGLNRRYGTAFKITFSNQL